MKKIEIQVINKNIQETAIIEFDRKIKTLTFTSNNAPPRTYNVENFYMCFGMIRADFPELTFLCKGAKINVHPSTMSSQMSSGLVAYELELGRHADNGDLVRIFDFEDEKLTNKIEEQKKFYRTWIDSLAHGIKT